MRAHRFANLILVSGVLLALAGAFVSSPMVDSLRPQDDFPRQNGFATIRRGCMAGPLRHVLAAHQGGLADPSSRGISRVTTVHCDENEAFLSYHNDEHGFHNPSGLWDRGDLDVAVVGDSFAHGNCVRSEENAVARIRADFPATFNLGIEANGPLL